ncbi:MAG: DUF502 domain-containing protein [Nitrospirota bacterium]|nr:DUF502 domain-containing protein [Nitrospirota bacterium]
MAKIKCTTHADEENGRCPSQGKLPWPAMVPFVNDTKESVKLNDGRARTDRVPDNTMSTTLQLKRYFFTGLLVLVPASGTYLILHTLFQAIDGLIAALLGPAAKFDMPGLGLISLLGLILLTGLISTHFLGERLVRLADATIQDIPLVRSIYLTLKGMTDLFNFRTRFSRSTVVVFPFPRDGLWALGFVMGEAPAVLQVFPLAHLMMVFVPTAIHPFTGYLAFVPQSQVISINLPPEDAMKLEFSAGLYQPRPGWLSRTGQSSLEPSGKAPQP